MPRRVRLLLLFRLCAHLLDGVAVAAGTVLDAAVDAADGGGADLHGLYDLVVGAAAEQELGRIEGELRQKMLEING